MTSHFDTSSDSDSDNSAGVSSVSTTASTTASHTHHRTSSLSATTYFPQGNQPPTLSTTTSTTSRRPSASSFSSSLSNVGENNLLALKEAQIQRLEKLLHQTTDEHIVSVRYLVGKSEKKLKASVAKVTDSWKKDKRKYEGKIKELKERGKGIEREARELSSRVRQAGEEVLEQRARVSSLSVDLRASREQSLKNLTTKNKLESGGGGFGELPSPVKHYEGESQLELMSREVGKLREFLLLEKEAVVSHKKRGDEAHLELGQKSARLLSLQESLTVLGDDNTRLSQALEYDRSTKSGLEAEILRLEKAADLAEMEYLRDVGLMKDVIAEKERIIGEVREDVEEKGREGEREVERKGKEVEEGKKDREREKMLHEEELGRSEEERGGLGLAIEKLTSELATVKQARDCLQLANASLEVSKSSTESSQLLEISKVRLEFLKVNDELEREREEGGRRVERAEEEVGRERKEKEGAELQVRELGRRVGELEGGGGGRIDYSWM